MLVSREVGEALLAIVVILALTGAAMHKLSSIDCEQFGRDINRTTEYSFTYSCRVKADDGRMISVNAFAITQGK